MKFFDKIDNIVLAGIICIALGAILGFEICLTHHSPFKFRQEHWLSFSFETDVMSDDPILIISKVESDISWCVLHGGRRAAEGKDEVMDFFRKIICWAKQHDDHYLPSVLIKIDDQVSVKALEEAVAMLTANGFYKFRINGMINAEPTFSQKVQPEGLSKPEGVGGPNI